MQNRIDNMPITIQSLKDMYEVKELFLDRALRYVLGDKVISNKQSTEAPINRASLILNQAFDFSINQIFQDKNNHDQSQCHLYDLSDFLSIFSDALDVTLNSIMDFLYSSHIHIYLPSNRQMQQNSVLEKNDLSCKENDEMSIACFNIYSGCYEGKEEIHLINKNNFSVLQFIDKNEPVFQTINQQLRENLRKNVKEVCSLDSYLKNKLKDYHVSSTIFKHPVFNNWCISCYPKEKSSKVDMITRFSSSYVSLENQTKYARPILDLEIIPAVGVCVRCYLSLADRPRKGREDKDITQYAESGKIIFKDINLMNFSDPLRALTWVEDYLKNDEHPRTKMGLAAPIIRSFLMAIDNYHKVLANLALIVDADRAPGQVKLQVKINSDENNQHPFFQAVGYSLVSFMNREAEVSDGQVKAIEDLSSYLLSIGQDNEQETRIHPKDFTKQCFISHQHGRPIGNSKEIYYAIDLDPTTTKVGPLLEARRLERSLPLSGFTSKIGIPDDAKFVQEFHKIRSSEKKYLVKKSISSSAPEKLTRNKETAMSPLVFSAPILQKGIQRVGQPTAHTIVNNMTMRKGLKK